MPGTVVIDTRDSLQKGFMSQAAKQELNEQAKQQLAAFRNKNKELINTLGKRKVRAASFDMLQKIILKNKKYRTQTLLIFDQVGKQVRWLMYNLEAEGIKDYYFLEKGALGVIGIRPMELNNTDRRANHLISSRSGETKFQKAVFQGNLFMQYSTIVPL